MGLATESSLSHSMDEAVKHYSSLFKLPSYKKVISFLALVCIIGGLAFAVKLLQAVEWFISGLFLGVSVFFINVFVDYFASSILLRRDPIYDLRRTVALSFYCWVLWSFFIVVGAIVTVFAEASWVVRFLLLGFSAVLILRLIVLNSTSFASYKRLLVVSVLQPFSCIIPFMFILTNAGYPLEFYRILLFFVFSVVVSVGSSFFFLFSLNGVGKQMLGFPSMSLFKAFLLNWIANLNAPFEEFLERLGERQTVEVSLIKFNSSKPKAFIVTPSIHPGPFKNIGSSLLPSQLKTTLEKKLNCVVCVPHGLFGHEFDLASQIQNQKIINSVVENADFEVHEAEATPFVKVSNGLATVCCQIFGHCAFLSFTLAPKTTEDFPPELGMFIRQEAEKYGIGCCVIVNAHNSIDGTVNIQEALDALKTVAATCLEKAVSQEKLPFDVGAATVIPKEFGLKDGMGPGGITVVVVKVYGQKTAYVVVDGNNMVAGLREKILSALHSLGIDEGEVFTTDTHSVNAVVLNKRGYHPIGEVINHENLIGHIKEAAITALSDLEQVKVACRRITVSDVTVIGENLLEKLCVLIGKTIQRAKKIVIPIFATSGLLLMLFLLYV
jgi:putative membrane protein